MDSTFREDAREQLVAKAGKSGALILTLLMALDDAADYLSATHQNLTNGEWDDPEAKASWDKIQEAITTAHDEAH